MHAWGFFCLLTGCRSACPLGSCVIEERGQRTSRLRAFRLPQNRGDSPTKAADKEPLRRRVQPTEVANSCTPPSGKKASPFFILSATQHWRPPWGCAAANFGPTLAASQWKLSGRCWSLCRVLTMTARLASVGPVLLLRFSRVWCSRQRLQEKRANLCRGWGCLSSLGARRAGTAARRSPWEI